MPSKRYLIALLILGVAALSLIPRAFTQSPGIRRTAAVPEKKGETVRLQIGELQVESGSLSEFPPAKT